jgi:multiple sugar transport system substrate-binding protein
MAGRLAAVTSSSGEAAAAEGFVGWLTAGDVSSRIASYSPQAWPCRASHRKVLSRWLGELPQPAAESYFAAIEQSQSHAQSLPAVRLIEPHRYLEALDEAVSRTINEKQQPQAALEEAAAAWQKITAEVGIDGQKAALRHSLGLD